MKGAPNETWPLHMEIYLAFCLDVAQGHMKGAPNKTWPLHMEIY